MNEFARQIETPNIAVITPHQLSAVSTREIFELLGEYGAILFRSCIHTPETFSDFVASHSSRLSLDPARTMVGAAAQLVDAGTDAVGLHCENGNSPFWPDLTWFYCQQAPRKGSQTTICDGEQVLGSLSAQCRDFFESNDIRYSRTVPGEMWRRLVCHYSRTVDDPANVYFDDLLALVDGTPGTTITYNGESDAIHYSFVTSAIQISSFSNRPAFANSILGPSYNYEQPVIDTAAGIPIPTTFLDEVQDVSALATHPVGWQDNDTIVLDNRRVMHGRQAIIDMRRVIFNALSYR